jgi:hypothetical protein
LEAPPTAAVNNDPPPTGVLISEPPSRITTPYAWDETKSVAPEVLQLWTEVGHGIDKNQTGT